MDPVVCEQEGGEEDQGEEEVDRGREGEGELGHPTPHNGEGRGITLRRVWNSKADQEF